MTQHEAQDRNNKILQLLGILPRVAGLIPEDIVGEDKDKQDQLKELALYFLMKIQDAKVKRFTCEKCNSIHGKATKNKKAYKCDYCGDWFETLYTIKKEIK